MDDGKPSSHPPMVGGEDDMDVGDCSEEGEEEDEEEEEIEMGSSPLEDHGSLMMALASSNVLPYEGLASPLRLASSGGKPLGLRRGPGRPPRRGTPPHSSRQKKPLGLKLKRWRGSVYMPSDKSPRHSMDGDTMLDGGTERGVDGSPAHSSEPNTHALSSDDKHDKFSQPSYVSDEPPYFQETWPGKVCSLCNLSERTQLGQGEMIKVTCPEGFTPQKKDVDPGIMSPPNDPDDSLLGADKSPRCSTAPALSYRRQKSWSKSRNSSINGQEPLDELAIIGYTEEPDLTNLFEHSNDQWVVYVHESCSLWSLGITRPSDTGFQAIGQIVINASVKKCSSCNKFGASTACTFSGCTKYFHLPCAAASGCFQDAKSYALVCNVHLHHVPLMPNLRDVTCMSCYSLGDVSNLVMCSMCGNNYHGSCVGLALLPGARAGWQCTDCRMCQVCRQPEDSKIMVCETCDKAYHPHCLRPIVTTVPKYGWKCKCCRLCSDCGSRTPGAGQSSRWHAHYTVCDSCYQQRNKGFSCPLCRRAYRAAAYREMVQCSKCKKFVHGTCDLEADLATYQLKKETSPDYEYVCPNCKSGIQNALKRKDSTEDFCMDSNMSASQESLLLDEFDFDCDKEGFSIGIGLGKGKPFSASKIAKKKLGLGCGIPGRPGKGLGKISGISLSVMSSYQKKHQRCNEFGRKRIPKAKMRGIFGVPGLGLQRPQADTTTSKSDEEPGGENRLVLCSAKDKFVLTQDMCVMCGALGTDQEGCLIACAQCGQCYHPYCVSVKVTKVILQKGWRCLDCTVCEGCGLKNDEARLILCDDCDISFHIYCMDPPLSYVPRGTWKCKWCAQCLTCGVNNPGFNCVWLRNYTECGPCASRTTCPSCAQCYGDGELIIKCIQCERWLHCLCDQIRDENEAEFCAEEGYTCVLCRPRDVKPPHLLPGVFHSKPRPLSPPGSPDYTKLIDKDDFYVVDGVKLSESGLHQIRALTIEQQVQPRKKRSGPRRHHGFGDREISRPPTFTDKEASVLATIESVVAGDCGEDVDDDSITIKEEVVSRYKEGMEVTPRPDGRAPEPPEGFSIYTTESGVMVLRRKRQRNLQRLGIGGFNARLRQTRCRDKEEESGPGDGVPATTPTTPGGSDSATTPTTPGVTLTGGPDDKPRRKPQRRKPKSKLVENYPSYLQEAFFGRDLLDTSKDTSQDLPSSSDESEDGVSRVSQDKTITLSQDELKVMEQMKIKQEKECDQKKSDEAVEEPDKSPIKQEEDDGSDSEALKDILHLPDNLLDTDLVNTIMTEGDGDIKSEDALMADSSLADDAELNRSSSPPPKDELSDILGPHFNLESMVRETGLPNMDCKDVEEIFKGVLTDESQESQESSSVFPGTATGGVHPQSAPPIMSSHSVIQNGMGLPRQPGSTLPSVVHSNLPSPINFPSASPYHSEYSNSPQFSPAFSEPPSPWADDGEGNGGPHSHYNQRNTLKMEADETLANNATISCVLYANINHPEWKKEYPTWAERSKQILKKWRALPSEKKAPYLQQARDNRANLRMKKAQQIPKELSPVGTPTSGNPPASGTTVAPQPTSTGQTAVAPTKPEVAEELITLGEGSGKQQNPREDTQSTSSPEDLIPTPSPSSSQEPAQTLVSTGSNTSPFLTIPSPTTNKSIETVQETRPTPPLPPTPPSLPTPPQPARTPQITTVTQFQPIVTEAPQTFPTTIPSHPSTIQYIPLIPSGNGQTSSIRATFHIIPTKPIVTTSNETPRTIYQYDRGTIHYPPNSVQILQSVPPLIMTSGSVLSATVQSNSDNISQIEQKSSQPRMLQLISAQRTVTTSTSPPQISTVPISPTIRSQVQFIQTIRTTSSATNNDTHDNNHPPRTPSNPPTSSPLSDQHIRVLTPSEIMRTLPSLGQENYDPPPSMEQDKLQQQQKTCREAEQERQWKQMQALRQQQAAQQQQVMQDQRAQAASRVHRQLSGDGGVLQMNSEPQSHLTSQLQVSTVQDSGSLPSMTSPGGVRTSQQFPSPVGLKGQHVGSPVIPNYPRSGTPALPIRGVVNPPSSQDPFAPPRQMQPIVHPAGVQGQEMNRQLRDLLQRQHIKNKLESEQMIQQRVWPLQEEQGMGTSPTDSSGSLSLLSPVVSQSQSSINYEPNNPVTAATNSPTFRHPLPPSLARPTRLPLQQGQMIIRGQRMPQFSDPRMQGVDPRVRLLLQQQQRPGFSPNNQMIARISGPRNPLDPYDHLVQQRPEFQDGPGSNIVRQMPSNLCNDSSRIQSPAQNPSLEQQRIAVNSGGDSREEIPESVTAELEKLEQEEGSTIPEVENVGAILGDLVEDDDELLAEMGADFNILEYADPELDTVTGGEKTNILDVDLEEEDTKKDNASINNRSEKKEDVVTPRQDPTPSAPGDKVTNDNNVDKKPLNNLPSESTQSSTNQSSLPLMTMSPSNNTVPPLSQSSQNSMVGGVLTQSSGGIVATVSYPATFPVSNQPLPRIQHIGQVAAQQQQRLQQLQRLGGGPRVVSVGPGGQILPPQAGQPSSQQGLVNSSPGLITATNTLMSPTGTARLAPPPPPYPGPPPPYPGPIQQGGFRGLTPPLGTPTQRRPLLLQEQPLLLEDLLEQEKREQEKQASVEPAPATALLSDADFERLRADVLGTSQGNVVASPPHGLPAQGILPAPGLVGQSPTLRPQFVPRPPTQQPQWQQSQPTIVRTPVLQQETTLRVPLFNAPVLPPPTPPPDIIVTEQDRQQQLHYETWLNNQNHIVTQQLKYYETEVQKLRKIRKSLNSKQRQLRKNGNELAENDAMELQRVTAEQAVLQKQLESSRKQSRQHGVLIQEYRNKQQANKVVRPGGLNTPLHSSPSGSSPQSPLLTSPSPGPLSVSQQQSPRIGTPHSQGDDNPFSPGTPGNSDILRSLPSPSRLTSPSPRGITSPRAPNPPSSTPRPNVGSPGSFTVQDQSIRPLGMPPRFVRSPESGGLRPRAVGLPLQVPGPTSSPAVYQGPRNVGFTSNPQPIMTAINDNKMVRLGGLTPQQQQMLLRQQLHQQRQALLQQQQELTQEAGGLRQIAQQRLEQQQQQQQQGEGPTPQQRQIQLVHQKQALLQQQELLQQQLNEPNLTPQQRQQIMQQRQALIHQSTEIAVQEKAVRLLLQNQEGIEGSNINRQQFQMLQHRQQQLAQQTRQQLILSQQGKTGQFRQMIQQQQGPQQQSPSRSPMGQFGQTSPMPSPIVQHFSGTPTSPMPPQSPIQQGQFPGSSPMHPQSPMVNQTQSSSPILPQSPIGVQQQFNQPNNSPMHSQSPMLQQYSNQNTPNSPMPPHSPRVQQQFSNQTPSSPMTPQSPMLQNPNYQHQVTTPPMQPYNQPPNSPMQSPRMQPQYGQPPSSPITPQSPLLQQNQFVHRPNSPMPPKSPMPPMGSPMPMRRPSSTGGSIASSPQIPDRPQSVENPLTPRTPQDYEGGGGNPHNPMNPIPFPSGFGRFGYIKLGLRGGSPMWGSDRQPPRKPSGQKNNRDGSGPSKSEHSINAISALKTGSLVSLDYNEFEDDSSRNSSMTPPGKMLQKKQQIIEVQEQPSKPSDDNELTVYDDIVLVESCKDETNLEVEELQSSLESNVMSMPMVLDSGHMQIPDMNLGSGNVEGQLLEECLVSSTDLVVLDVEPSESEECLLDMVEKDHMDSGSQDLLILEDDLVERESKDDESDVIELMEESSSPPTGRKRMAGKVLPGETLRKVQEKRDSTTDTPESPDQDESHADPLSETDNELISSFENTEKSETVSTTTPEGYHLRDELKTKTEETKNNFPVMASSAPPSSMHQANIGIPGLTRQTMSYPTFPRNPSFPRHVLPIIKSDGRPVFAVQATVANLVQDAVNAAKLAAEKKNLNHGVSLSGGVVIPNILSTPSTIASLGVVSTTCSTLIGPPRMSVPFPSGGRVTVTTAPTGTHYVPILSQSDKLGLLKIEGIKVINQKIELSDKSSDKLSDKQMPKITSAMLITSHPSNESASTSDRIFQRRYFEDKFKSDIKPTGSTKSEDLRPATPQIPTPTKFHNYSKVLVKTSDRQLSPGKQGQDMDSESRRSEIIQKSEGPENLSSQNSIIIKNYSNESVRHTGVICNKRSSIDLTSSTTSSHTSSVITQVSVISDNKSATTPSSLQDNLYKSEVNVQTNEESGSVSSSILEAQLTATCNRDDLIPRTSSAASPSKTLFSFLDNVTPPIKDKPQIREPQSVSVNISNISLPFDDQKIHTEGMTLYRSSENITAHSNIPHMFKSTQSISELKLPTSVSEFKNMQEDSRIMSQPAIFSQSVRRIGNIYVHSQNVKSESNIHQSESPTGKDNDSSDQKQTQRNVSVLYSTDQSFQNQSKDTETATMKTDLNRTSSMTDLLRSGQKRETVFERQNSSESREIEKINLERHIGSSKSMPTRLGELISGSASVQAHIERRISIAGQTDLMSNRNVRFFQKEESQSSDNLQQRTVSSSESSTSVVFTSGAVQRENVTTETNTTPTQFIPLSSMLTPKIETDDKLIRISSHSVPRISEESQNVLLKQLLQNTACATTVATPTTPVNTLALPPPLSTVETQRIVATTTTVVTQNVEPTQKIVQSPVTTQSSTVPVPKVTTPPTPQNIAPAASIKTPQESPQPEVRRMSTGTPTSAGTPTSTLDELLSPTSSCSMPQTSPIVIKREPMLTPSQIKREPIQQSMSVQPMTMTSPLSQKSPVMVEVKKEIISSDEMISPSLRHQENSDVQMSSGNLEQNSNMPLDPQDIKKLKRRQYQQKRRQSQGKDAIGGTPKKRPRKNSKVEEDYDSFIDALMVQLRQTPAMSILEPSLSRNYTVCPIFGSGDLSKVSCNTRLGDLKGMYGSATLSTESDYYNTQPYGDLLPVPPQSTPSTQRGFYNEEFAPLKLDTCKDELDERKLEFNRDRDNDTPDTIVSSSSPECFVPEIPIRYPGLRLIEDDDSDEDERLRKRGSPFVPLFVPQPIKPKSNRFFSEMDKENQYGDHALIKTRLSPSIPLKDSGNVTVTLTLTSAAADDVLGVLRNLANVLRIPAPTAFHITERTATPPSHKLGLYRCKGKDGKEGAPIDIQSILNGAAKFCRHCDVVILNNLIKKKASEMPFLAREEGSEDLYFCSSACYMQLALLHHPPSISKDKAAAIVDHLSQNDPSPPKKTRLTSVSEAIGEIKKKSVKSDSKHDNFLSLKMDLDEVKTHAIVSSEHKEPAKKDEVIEEKKPRVKGLKYRFFNSNAVPPPASKHKKPTDKEMTDMLFRMGITVTPVKLPDDSRVCLFCHQVGDGIADGPARLLNYDVDKWVHLNCALWSDEVYETVNGALMNVETALQQSLTAGCTLCHRTGATLKCYKMRCLAVYHLACAVKDECIFYKNKTLYCNLHVPKNEKDNELTTLSVFRRVYVNRDENRQVASVMHHTEHNHLLRVGALIFLNVGQLLPHQLAAFHTPNYIYPIGYKIIRFYWSMRVCNKRCRYVCSIHEANGRPEFRVLIQEPAQDDIELRDLSPRAVWTRILEPLSTLRKTNNNVQVFPRFVSGEDLFGLTEPAIVKVLESLPGVETLTDYRFKYGRNPLLELPLAINPSGCARCEGKPKGQGQWKRAHTQRTGSASRPNFTPTVGFAGDAVCPYSKQFVHSKSSQYKKMKQEWRNNVYLARSKIQGLGLYAARDLEKHTMVIEYIGEIIRTELAESREKQYEAKNRGIYMFRLDEERVVDATLSGGLARYINHSCNPNCVAETVEVERDQRIIIFAKRRISRGEELAYDYKFDIEDDQHKIPCMCGAPNCRKWMN